MAKVLIPILTGEEVCQIYCLHDGIIWSMPQKVVSNVSWVNIFTWKGPEELKDFILKKYFKCDELHIAVSLEVQSEFWTLHPCIIGKTRILGPLNPQCGI